MSNQERQSEPEQFTTLTKISLRAAPVWAMVSLWPPLWKCSGSATACEGVRCGGPEERAAVGAPVCDPEPPDILRPSGKSCRLFPIGVSDQNCLQRRQDRRPAQCSSCSAAQSLCMGVDAAAPRLCSVYAKFSSSESVMWRRMDICDRLFSQRYRGIMKVISIIKECSHTDDNVYIFLSLHILCIRLLFTIHHGIDWVCWKGYNDP